MINMREARLGWACGLVAAAVAVVRLSSSAQGPVGPGGPGGASPPFAGLPGMEERKILAQFDKDGNTRLDATERKAAREWLATQPATGFGGFGGRRGFGPPAGFTPPPGFMAPGFGGRGRGPTSPGRRMTPADVKPAGRAALYDTGTLRTVFLQFDNADWEQELADFHNTDVEVPATVVVDGESYRDVGVHFRGMSSFMMVQAGSKRSLNLSFDFVNDDQRLLGHRTLNLLNVNGDATFVRPVLYPTIAQRYLPAPKANYVRVAINGEYWGVYVSAEQFNSDFVRDRFGTRRGARWKVPGMPFGQGGMTYLGEEVDAYKRSYDIKSKDDPKSWTSLIHLFKVLNETPASALEAALTPILDVDGALKFLALEVALVNSDGYWARASDYSIYQDEKGRFHVIPHDMNEGLAEESGPGGRGRGGFGRPPGSPAGGTAGLPPGFPPLPPGGFAAIFPQARVDLDPLTGLDDASKPLRSKLLAVPALRARYLGYVRDIAENWLDWKVIGPLAQQYQTLIAADVKADTRKLYTFEAFEAGVSQGDESLKSFADRRRAFLLSGK